MTALAPHPSPAAPSRPLGRVLPRVAAGAALVLVADAYHLLVLHDRPTQLLTAGYRAHGLLLIAGLLLLGLSAPALVGAGRLARTALPLLATGTALVVGDAWAEVVVVPGVVRTQPGLTDAFPSGFHLGLVIAAFAVFAIAWLLVGIAAARAGRCSTAAAVLLCVGAVAAFLPFGGSYVLLALGALAVAATTRDT